MSMAQFGSIYGYSTEQLVGNNVKLNTAVSAVPGINARFHNLPAPDLSAIITYQSSVTAAGSPLGNAVSPAPPLTNAITAIVDATQQVLKTISTELSKLSSNFADAASVGDALRAQGVQTPYGSGGSGGANSVGLSESQRAAIAAGPGEFGSSQRAAYNAATGRGGSPVVGGADPALSRVNTGGSSNSGLGGSCFIRGTKILMANGTVKNAEDVVIGDVLLGMDGFHNAVIELDCPPLNYKREIPRLFGFNGGPAFVTAEHPFYSDRGWLAINATEFAIMKHNMAHLGVKQMVVGDVLHMHNGDRFLVKSIDEYLDVDPEQQVFNYILDGNNTYYADGFIAHNRTAASRGYSSRNTGTNSTGTGPGDQVGSSSGAGPYSNGGGSGASFNSGGSTSGTGGGVNSNPGSFGGPR
jgi:hypothetical protein